MILCRYSSLFLLQVSLVSLSDWSSFYQSLPISLPQAHCQVKVMTDVQPGLIASKAEELEATWVILDRYTWNDSPPFTFIPEKMTLFYI